MVSRLMFRVRVCKRMTSFVICSIISNLHLSISHVARGVLSKSHCISVEKCDLGI